MFGFPPPNVVGVYLADVSANMNFKPLNKVWITIGIMHVVIHQGNAVICLGGNLISQMFCAV